MHLILGTTGGQELLLAGKYKLDSLVAFDVGRGGRLQMCKFCTLPREDCMNSSNTFVNLLS